MKDRIPKYPGRVKLTPVSGQTDVFDMVRADEPEEAGTPINKQTLLTDETAVKLGLDPESDPTPDEALNKLGGRIGDIKETLRTDLGEDWLLCNGDPVPDGEYPALRDMLHYNTEWKRLPLLFGYGTVRPMPVAGQWLLLRTQNAAFHFAFTAYLYDANTGDLKTITCPEQSGSTVYGIAGMTHDGNRYILVVSDTTNSKVIFYTTNDFVTWTQIYTKAMLSTSYHAFDVSWDGGNILWMEGYTTSGTTKYRIRCVNKALSKVTELTSAEGSTSYLQMFYLLPNGYWTRYNSNDTSVSVYPAGKSESTGNRLFYFSSGYYLARIVFFNDKYWLGIPLKGESQRSIQYVDLASKTVSTIGVERTIMGATATSSYGYLYDVEYLRESNEWVMYVTFKKTSNDAAQFYHVYISADADPSVADNYRRVRVDALPEILPSERMAPDRSRMYVVSDVETYLRDPNQKYLPLSDGDAYKYIYIGGVDE